MRYASYAMPGTYYKINIITILYCKGNSLSTLKKTEGWILVSTSIPGGMAYMVQSYDQRGVPDRIAIKVQGRAGSTSVSTKCQEAVRS